MVSSSSRIYASKGFPNFKYTSLDLSSSRPSIRLAILQRGPPTASVRVQLRHSTFADRPQYEALSYTWGSPDGVRAIELNGTRVDIRVNLWHALQSLRSVSEDRVLWIDAICIDQGNNEEKSYQVKLMAHIFSRAEEVLVWLGSNLEQEIHSLEKQINNPMVDKVTDKKAALAELSTLRQQRRTAEFTSPNTEDYDLCIRPYWKRLWIVQEIGAATELKVHWGSKSATWNDFFTRIQKTAPYNADLPIKLAKQREDRHGDSYLLANLIEVCQDSLCLEPRDKIYGFVGIAHDCQDGSLPVDYSKSLFEVYEDVVKFQYMSAVDLGAAKKKTVHFSQLVQRVLGGSAAMQRDFFENGGYQLSPMTKLPDEDVSTPEMLGKDFLQILEVKGESGGTITNIGPSYSEIIGNPEAKRSWNIMLSKAGAPDIGYLRRMNEGFMRVLLKLGDADLARISPIPASLDWSTNIGKITTRIARNTESESPPEYSAVNPGVTSEPRLFLTSNFLLGLAPSNAMEGDQVIQFQDSEIVAVVRHVQNYESLVGRAAIANSKYEENSKFHIAREVKTHIEGTIVQTSADLKFTTPMCMDIYTLSLLTQ